jgi:hypothetical protein
MAAPGHERDMPELAHAFRFWHQTDMLPQSPCPRSIRTAFGWASRMLAVGEYLLNHPDPTFDAKIASVFKGKYDELKIQAIQPDEIMDCLYEFTLGGQQNSTPREVAVWSLLAHLFEKCTIFEDHPFEAATAQ